MSEGGNEPGEITVGVGEYGPGGYPESETFRGTEIRRVPAIMEDREEFGRYRDYILFSTPDEGLKIYEQETVRRGSMERQPGQRAAELQEVGARLFTEEELRQERPEIIRHLFDGD